MIEASRYHLLVITHIVLALGAQHVHSTDPIEVTVSTDRHEYNSKLGQDGTAKFKIDPPLDFTIQAELTVRPETSKIIVFPDLKLLDKNKYAMTIKPTNENGSQTIDLRYQLSSKSFGQATVSLSLDKDSRYNVVRDNAFIDFNVPQSDSLNLASEVSLWISGILISSCVWPQIVRNFLQRSSRGLVFDYVELTWTTSLTGFIKAAMLTSDTVRFQALDRFGNWWPEIGTRDWFCVANEMLASSVLIFQFMYYKTGNSRLSNLSSFTSHFDTVYIVTSVFTLYAILANYANWSLYLHVTIVVNITARLLRDIIQIYYNYQRKTTENFTVLVPILELIGSLLQPFVLMFNFINFGSYKITATLATAWALMILDKIMMMQHFYWFKSCNSNEDLEPACETHEEPDEIQAQQSFSESTRQT